MGYICICITQSLRHLRQMFRPIDAMRDRPEADMTNLYVSRKSEV